MKKESASETTAAEEAVEQAFLAKQVGAQPEAHTEAKTMKKEAVTTPELEKELDSLGQDNPARAMERKNIEEAKKDQEEKDKEAKKAEK